MQTLAFRGTYHKSKPDQREYTGKKGTRQMSVWEKDKEGKNEKKQHKQKNVI